MNFKKNIILIASLFAFSCENEKIENDQNSTLNSKLITFNNLEINVPLDFPEDIMEINEGTIEETYIKTLKTNSSKLRLENPKTFLEVIIKIEEKYPSFDSFIAKDYKKYFPKLTIQEIEENASDIELIMEKLMAYEVATTFAKEGDGKVEIKLSNSNKSRYGDPSDMSLFKLLLQCESWYYATHLKMSRDGIFTAIDRTFDMQKLIFGEAAAGNNMPDALRHGVWTVLNGKYACTRYSTTTEAIQVSTGFVASHECNDSSPDSGMDVHNNSISGTYYSQNVERYNVGFLNWNTRVNKSDEQIANEIHAKGYNQVPFTYNNAVNSSLNFLCYFY